MSTPSPNFSGLSVESVIRLARLEAMTPHAWHKVLRAFSLEEVTKQAKKDLLALGLTEQQANELSSTSADVALETKLLKAKGISIVTLVDPTYPKLLREIDDPPLWLFYRGNLAVVGNTCLTVVGSRKPSNYALEILPRLLGDDLLQQVAVLSGLAYGVDKQAHQLSMKSGGRTAAVLAGGLDVIYPTDHSRLAEQIVEQGGALISEYPPLSRPRPYRFPVRNRILAGLSPLTLVVEAAIKSGTLTTAKAALDYNRDLMAVPGDITRRNSEGGNFLIKRGAMVADSPEDLLQYYGFKGSKEVPLVDNHLGSLLDLLSDDPLSVDAITLKTGQTIDVVLAGLTQLELLGLVYQAGGEYQKVINK